MSSPKSTRKASKSKHRSTLSLQKTEIVINVYDLLPPGRLSSSLWALGTSLLHSGVVINNREYAYGGHDRRNLTGVYFTPPLTVPPGGTHRLTLLHGFTVSPQSEIDQTIKQASEEFQGTAYNLLTKNCNHFTSYLVERLSGRGAPSWLNRAASIGVALPCVVPREWISPPDFETDGGALLDEDEDASLHSSHEGQGMLRNMDTSHQRRSLDWNTGVDDAEWNGDDERRHGGDAKGKGKAPVRDTSGRVVPPADRAPTRTKGQTCDSP